MTRKHKARKEMKRMEALDHIALLPKDVREEIALVIETADAQGGYEFDGDGSVWMDSVNETLYALALEIRSL